MSLPNYLAKIKSSGIYRFVWDKSKVTATDAETLRLVVGYSEKGPFNTPVYFDNTADFKTTFGDVNKKLEKRGVFFHRMALQALAAGPIIALNLKKFNLSDSTSNTERVQYATSDTNGAFTVCSDTLQATLDKIYNTNRFWTLSPESLSDLPNANSASRTAGTKQYVTIAAADSLSSSNTIFIRPCEVDGYDVSIKTWYNTMGEEMPDYFEGYENYHIADFFAEIYVFKGQFTPAIAQSEELRNYFNVVGDTVTLNNEMSNAWGQSIDVLDALASNENSGFIQKYQGIMLPHFKNASGAYISLDLLFNADYNKHKMIMKMNGDLLDDETIQVKDIVTRGWDNINIHNLEMCVKTTTGTATGTWDNGGVTVLNDKGIHPTADLYDAVAYLASGATASVSDSYSTGGVAETVDAATGYTTSRTDTLRVSYDLHSIDDNANLSIFALTSNSSAISMSSDNKTITVTGHAAVAYAQKVSVGGRFIVGKAGDKWSVAGQYNNQTLAVASLVKVQFTEGSAADSSDAKLALTFDTEAYPVALKLNNAGGAAQYCIVRCNNILKYGTITAPLYLKGYVKTNTKPTTNSVEDKLKWQKSLLDVLNADSATGYPGLIEALTNRVDIDYRYIVDTFESFIDSEIKAPLALIAKKKDNCLLLSNFPAIQTFMKSKNTSFVDDNGMFKMKYIKQGANTSKPASVLFSLPSADNGAAWCSFNTPVVFTDGTVKTTVPAAALVSNNFMEKYNSRQPYYIVAGPNYGRLSYTGMVGPDYNFSRDDLDILEPMGVNATVYVPRKGTFINSNQTAKQNPVTALSKINVRELVIYLQDQIEDMMQNYQWEFNTQSLRDMIKAKADTICENVQANGGIYKFENVCDETNNTDDVINNEMIVLSTSIEPGMGAGKMVQELTLYKKGGMTSVTTNG